MHPLRPPCGAAADPPSVDICLLGNASGSAAGGGGEGREGPACAIGPAVLPAEAETAIDIGEWTAEAERPDGAPSRLCRKLTRTATPDGGAR